MLSARALNTKAKGGITEHQLKDLEILRNIHDKRLEYIAGVFSNTISPAALTLLLSNPIFVNFLTESLLKSHTSNSLGKLIQEAEKKGLAVSTSEEQSAVFYNEIMFKVSVLSQLASLGMKVFLVDKLVTKMAKKYSSSTNIELTPPALLDSLAADQLIDRYLHRNKNLGTLAQLSKLPSAFYAVVFAFFLSLEINTNKDLMSILFFTFYTYIHCKAAILGPNEPTLDEEIIEIITARSNLNKLLLNCQQEVWVEKRGIDAESTIFTLTTTDFNNVVATQVKETIKNTFKKFNIPFTPGKNHAISIKGDISLTDTLIHQINHHIFSALVFLDNIKILTGQLRSIAAHIGWEIKVDEKPQLATCTFSGSIYLSTKTEKALPLLETFFRDKLTITSLNHKIILSMTSIDPIDENALAILLSNLKRLNEITSPSISNTSSSSSYLNAFFEGAKAKKERKVKTEESEESVSEESDKDAIANKTSTSQITPQKKSWNNEAYVLGGPDANIYSFPEGPLPRDTFFAGTTLKPEHFTHPYAYDAHLNQVQAPRIARKTGDQGFAFPKKGEGKGKGKKEKVKMAMDPYGQLFAWETKITFKNELGDLRIYCETKKNEANEVLILARGVNEDAHKDKESYKKR